MAIRQWEITRKADRRSRYIVDAPTAEAALVEWAFAQEKEYATPINLDLYEARIRKVRMYEVRRGPEDLPISVRHYTMAETGEQAIAERKAEMLDNKDNPNPKWVDHYAAMLIATEVVQHPETGRWVPVDWREKRIAEIEGQVEYLVAEMNKLREAE